MLPPLWAALQSSFWIIIEFWVITLSQTLACTWFLLHRVLVLPNVDENSDFWGFRLWFLDSNMYKKVKIYFFLYNSTHIFKKWKKKYFNNVLDTYICFQSSNFIQWVTFCQNSGQKGQNSGPNIWGTSWNFGEKICQLPNVII